MQGMFGIMANVTWPRFFGRGHLGAVAGFAMALNVAGTAVGPTPLALPGISPADTQSRR
jgi:OFA family oxalate/formate antiporter-like MFS transporter